ncbi:MAG: rhomboid family intramembrane serine protease [Pseudomonadota bacterium]
MTTDAQHQPVFNAPAIVILTAGGLLLIHLGLTLLTEDDRYWLQLALGVIPARYADVAVALPGGAWSAYVAPLTHMAVHADWTHVIFNVAWFVAFGTIIARRLSTLRFVLFFVITGLFGALAFVANNFGLAYPMIGASGAIAGLMGGLLRLFPLIGASPPGEDRTYGMVHYPMPPLSYALRFRPVIGVIVAFLVINLVFATGIASEFAGEIAWEAHLGGFAAGVFLFGLFDRPQPAPEPYGYEDADM